MEFIMIGYDQLGRRAVALSDEDMQEIERIFKQDAEETAQRCQDEEQQGR